MVELKAPASFEYIPLPHAQLAERGSTADVPFRLSYPSGNKAAGASTALGALGACFAFVQLLLFASQPLNFSIVAILSIPAAMLLLLTWATLVLLLNRTIVELSGGMLVVRHGPVPNPIARKHTLPSASIYAAAVDSMEVEARYGTRLSYSVSLTVEASIKKLVEGFQQEAEAAYICALLESHLATLRKNQPEASGNA